jgi:hypothetical protein
MKTQKENFIAPIITYQAQFQDEFRKLNLEWIRKHFKVEQKDLDQVNNPQDCLAGGGQIFFVLKDNQAVGTCALYKFSPKA